MNLPLHCSRAALRLALLGLLQFALKSHAQNASVPVATNTAVHAIDLPSVLRLADAQNLDVQIARERLKEARANRDSATEQFLPWLSPGAAWRRHEGRIQAVDGTMLDANKQSYNVGAALTAQLDLGDAIYKSLAAKQFSRAADHALESQRQDSTVAAAQGYFDLAKAKVLMDVVQEALDVSRDYQRQLHAAVDAALTSQYAFRRQAGADFGQEGQRNGVPLGDGFAGQPHTEGLQGQFQDGAHCVIGLLSNFHDRALLNRTKSVRN